MSAKEIHIVRKGDYYNSMVCGYFSDREKAERYCVSHEDYDEYFIETAKCLDNLDLPELNIVYEYSVSFCNRCGTWKKYALNYTPAAFRGSRDGVDMYNSARYGDCLSFVICLQKKDDLLAEEKALCMLDELLSISNNNIDESAVQKMNEKLAAKFKEVK